MAMFDGVSIYHIVGSTKNPLEIKPSYSYWAPFIGPNCRKGRKLLNTEFRKANHKEDLVSAGATSDNCSVEKLMDLFSEGKVCHACTCAIKNKRIKSWTIFFHFRLQSSVN
jgi:hypothetical protein